MQLKIDPEFQSLLLPLPNEKFRQLEENIKADGCMDALVIWNGTIVDGHNRYKICQENGIPFNVEEKEFADRDEVVEWIIRNQFGRRDLSPAQRSELALRLKPVLQKQAKENQKISEGRGKKGSANSPNLNRTDTREELAKVAGVSSNTLGRVEVIHKKGTPEQIDRIRKGGKGNSVNAIYKEVTGKTDPVRVQPKDETEKEKAPAINAGYKVCSRCRQKMPLTAFRDSKLNGYSDDVCGMCIHVDMQTSGRRMKYSPMTKEEKANIQKCIDTIYDVTPVEDDTVESIVENLQATFNGCLGILEQLLENQLPMVMEKDNNKKIIAALSEAETAIEKLKGKYTYG